MSTAAAPRDTFPAMTTRDRWRTRMEPVARGFGRVGLTPNALTLIGFGIAVLAAYLAAERSWLYAGVFLIVGGLFDLFDGALARATGRTTKFGAFLDSTMDRWGEAVVYVGILSGCLAGGFDPGAILAGTAMASAFMVSYVRAKSEGLGLTPGRGMAGVGLAPREVRIVILTVGLIGAGLLSAQEADGPVMSYPPSYIVLVGSLALITILASVTTIQRIFHVYREAKQQEQQ